MKKYAEEFYKSSRWQKCRAAYLAEHHYVCNRCGRPATMVHHKIHLNEDRINDPALCYGWDNLEALCDRCHQHEHHSRGATVEGMAFDESGQLVRR